MARATPWAIRMMPKITISTPCPVITIEADDSSIVGGEDAEFTISADPAPSSNLWINIDVDERGSYLDGPAPTRVRLLSGRTSVPLNLPISCGPDGEIEVTIETGTGYTVGSPPSARVTVDIPCDPVITIEANDSSIVEGEDAEFTISANPAPTSNLWINIDVDRDRGLLGRSGPYACEAPQWTPFVPLDLPTVVRSACEDDGLIEVEIETGTGYTVGRPDDAEIDVTDRCPEITIRALHSAIEGGGGRRVQDRGGTRHRRLTCGSTLTWTRQGPS